MNPDETPHTDDYFVSFDKKLLDYSFVIREIQASYWGGWRSPIVVMKSIDNAASLCAGVYHRHEGGKDEQVGFARIVTDGCTFAWICDVIITKAHRGKGLGKFLMGQVMSHPEVAPRACMLATRDAHKLYEKFGFSRFEALKRLPGPTSE